jgi:hypothetical protein
MNKLSSIVVVAFSLASTVFSAPPEPAKPPVGIPIDAAHFKGKWYRLYLEEVNWEMAQRRCNVLGGRLATVPDKATWQFIQPLTKRLRVWLGASDGQSEGLWKWEDGSEMTFTAWHRRQPDNGWGVQHYLCTVNGGWDDVAKKDKLTGFVCEWNPR